MYISTAFSSFFFFNDTATTEIYTLSLHDALPIFSLPAKCCRSWAASPGSGSRRSEEHTSELQSRVDLVCRLLLEKKKKYYDFCLWLIKKRYMKKMKRNTIQT